MSEGASIAIVLIAVIIVIVQAVLQIYTIVKAAQRARDSKTPVLDIVIAIFVWPLYWILRAAGVLGRKVTMEEKLKKASEQVEIDELVKKKWLQKNTA